MDEPTSGVDALARTSLWDTIRAQSDRGAGVLVTTHYMQEARQCDRLLLMADGRLVAQGTEADIVGSMTAIEVHADDWARAFAALGAAGVPVMLAGRSIRVADGDAAELEHIARCQRHRRDVRLRLRDDRGTDARARSTSGRGIDTRPPPGPPL